MQRFRTAVAQSNSWKVDRSKGQTRKDTFMQLVLPLSSVYLAVAFFKNTK